MTSSFSRRPAGSCSAVKVVNQMLGAPSLENHPNKTFISKIERGFDLLGYHFGRERLRVEILVAPRCKC